MESLTFIIKKMLALATVLVAIMLLTSACGPQKNTRVSAGGGTKPPPGSTPGSTPGATPGGQLPAGEKLLLRTTSAIDTGGVTNVMVMNLDLSGQDSGQYDFNDPKVAIYYNGPVRGVGQMTISTKSWRFCDAPPGQYVVSSGSLQAGMWQSTVISNLRMEVSGPARLVLNVYYAGIPYSPQTISKNQVNRLGGTLIVESVNGQPCNQDIYMY